MQFTYRAYEKLISLLRDKDMNFLITGIGE